MHRRSLLVGSALLLSGVARAQTARMKIGVLTDLSGTYSSNSGMLSVQCARQAADEFSAATGIGVDVISADHQNKTDIGASIARRWFDVEGVDAIADVPNTAIALAVSDIAKAKNKALLATSPISAVLIGSQCTPNTIMWTHDAYGISAAVPPLAVKDGYDRWYLIGADYSASKQFVEFTEAAVKKAGGKVVGTALHPFPSSGDYSTYIVNAQSSGANVLGMCSFTSDMIGIMKQAAEFGLSDKVRRVAMLIYVDDIRALGLAMAKGMQCTTPYYWDLNDRTRAFNDRLKKREPGQFANQAQAGCYAATLHYLKAVQAVGVAKSKQDGASVVAAMKSMPTDDDCFGHGTIRSDGRKVHDTYILEVKRPEESRSMWDLLTLKATIPASVSVHPLDPACTLARI